MAATLQPGAIQEEVSEARAVSSEEANSPQHLSGLFQPRPWEWGDVIALLAWTMALAIFFRGPLFLSKALFYFDITEINLSLSRLLCRRAARRPLFALVPGALLRNAAF